MSRCTNPSTKTRSGYGCHWCVCDEHAAVIESADKKTLKEWQFRDLKPDDGILNTYRAKKENRARCQFDDELHADILARAGLFPTAAFDWAAFLSAMAEFENMAFEDLARFARSKERDPEKHAGFAAAELHFERQRAWHGLISDHFMRGTA